jgi:hypothetical protein
MYVPERRATPDTMRKQARVWLDKYQRALETNRRAYNRLSAAMIGVIDPVERDRLHQELNRVHASIGRIEAQRSRWRLALQSGEDPALHALASTKGRQ